MPGKASNPHRRVATAGALSVVVLAAGQGKRMHSDLPKVLQPLAGRPLLAHVLEIAQALEPASVHVVYGHGGEQVRAAFRDWPRLHWVLQADQLGTGHALAQALPAIPAEHRVLVLYGDVPLLQLATLRALCEHASKGLGLLTAQLADPSGYGRILRRGTRVVGVVEEPDASAAQRRLREVNTGVLVAGAAPLRAWLARLRPQNAQREYYLTDVIAMAARARVPISTASATPAEVQGVNDKLQLAAVEAEYRRRRAEELMRQGVTLVDPMRIDVRGSVTVARDVLLDVNVVLEGSVVLGAGVRIGPNCVLHNVVLGARTTVYANCVIQDAQFGEDCQIGPFTRVRPESRVAARVHLGNFVEIKNSAIGEGSKVNHLSYVGDAEVGQAVNVGAGTITCNYDGANKWPTRIGDRAFIGSGSMLVAPVEVGAEATIGAGSTITAPAPAGKLTLARSRQVTIEHWQPPRKGAKR